MSETAQSILAAALSLPESDRWEIIERLLAAETPPDNYEGMTEEEFQAEMKRRCEDTDPGIPWAEVKAQALKDIEEAAR
jgi:hypothetical protein